MLHHFRAICKQMGSKHALTHLPLIELRITEYYNSGLQVAKALIYVACHALCDHNPQMLQNTDRWTDVMPVA